MSDLSIFKRHNYTSTARPCRFVRLMAPLSDEQRKALNAALETPLDEIQHTAIAATMTQDWKVPTTEDSVRRHRNKQCSCFRAGA